MGHQDDGFRSILKSVFDRGKGTDNALVICDLELTVEWDIEVNLSSVSKLVLKGKQSSTYPNEDLLALKVDVGDSCVLIVSV